MTRFEVVYHREAYLTRIKQECRATGAGSADFVRTTVKERVEKLSLIDGATNVDVRQKAMRCLFSLILLSASQRLPSPQKSPYTDIQRKALMQTVN
jgi:hypothetical protein